MTKTKEQHLTDLQQARVSYQGAAERFRQRGDIDKAAKAADNAVRVQRAIERLERVCGA